MRKKLAYCLKRFHRTRRKWFCSLPGNRCWGWGRNVAEDATARKSLLRMRSKCFWEWNRKVFLKVVEKKCSWEGGPAFMPKKRAPKKNWHPSCLKWLSHLQKMVSFAENDFFPLPLQNVSQTQKMVSYATPANGFAHLQKMFSSHPQKTVSFAKGQFTPYKKQDRCVVWEPT